MAYNYNIICFPHVQHSHTYLVYNRLRIFSSAWSSLAAHLPRAHLFVGISFVRASSSAGEFAAASSKETRQGGGDLITQDIGDATVRVPLIGDFLLGAIQDYKYLQEVGLI
jgi:hypothetical protein